jgi:hypothetical protein
VGLWANIGHCFNIKGKVMSAFNKQAFESAFAVSILALAGSEKITKAELQGLSRTVLEAWHATGDHSYGNRLIGILTPVNKKVAVQFFLHFSGFSFDDKLGAFAGKSKKRYELAHKESMAFLEDPMNNIWSWADRNIEIVKKEFTLDQVTDGIKGYLKKANKENIPQVDVLRAIFKGGISVDSILALMDELGLEAEETVIEERVITE